MRAKIIPMLYDHRGREVRRLALQDEQGAPSLKTMRNYQYLIPGDPLTHTKLAEVLQQAAMGYTLEQSKLFSDMEERDVHIFSVMSKRKRAILPLDYTFQPATDKPEDVKIAEFVQNVWERIGIEGYSIDRLKGPADMLFAMGDAIGKDLSMIEMIWDHSEGDWWVRAAKHRPLEWFQFKPQTTEITLIDGSAEGEELVKGKWLVHYHPAKSGSPYRSSLFRVISWLYLFRNYAIKAWVEFVSVFGIPMRIGKYPDGTDESDQDRLLYMLDQLAKNASAVMPQGMEVDIRDAAIRGGVSDPHLSMLEWTARQIDKAVLGASMSAETETRGSYARDYVVNDIRLDILQSDIAVFAGTINRHFIKPVVDLNFGAQKSYPYIKWTIPKQDERAVVSSIISLAMKLGMMDIPMWWVYESLGIPKAGKDDETLKMMLQRNEMLPEQQAEKEAMIQAKAQAVASGQAVTPQEDQTQQIEAPQGTPTSQAAAVETNPNPTAAPSQT